MQGAQLGAHAFAAGADFSITDVVAFCGLALARLWRVQPDTGLRGLLRWEKEIGARPSAAIARY